MLVTLTTANSRLKATTAGVAALGLCAVLAAAGHAQDQVFRAGAETVPIFVTANDKSGRIVTDLTRADFQIFDNGKPQPLTVFDNSPQPIRLIVLLDASGSMSGNLRILRDACTALIGGLSPTDLARVGTFGETIEITPHFTRNPAELLLALPDFIPPNAKTPLWKAVDQAIGDFAPGDGRPVVLVMSDGKDSGPQFREKWISQPDVADRAERENVMIYGVGMRSRGPAMGMSVMQQMIDSLPDPGLGTVALDSGGGYYELNPHDDLSVAFARVVEELHRQYLLGFAPPAHDGKEHKLEVKVARKDVKVRARKAYRAGK